MIYRLLPVLLLAGLAIAPVPAVVATELDELQPDLGIADFRAEAVYENEVGRAIGCRLRHVPTGFVLDVLRIESLPQAFMWVNSAPPSDRGEPHTLEHLLLGKGTKGRTVASLEDMTLASSSAFTQQLRTCYHFHAKAGVDAFFELFEAKLDAMLHPNFSDEEIRREVCNMGLVSDEASGSIDLEEKGTVYNEMVSSFERPWGNLYFELGRAMYGADHPCGRSSGGHPPAIRVMEPQHIREFHASTHHLNNMGAVISIGSELTLDETLARLSAILGRIEPDARPGDDPTELLRRLPPPRPAAPGSIIQTHFPHGNQNEPGAMLFAWPARLDLDRSETYLLELLVDLLASGPTSRLYAKFIDSQTRVMDTGATSVFGWVSDGLGQPVYVGLSNVDPEQCDEPTLRQVRELILAELRSIAELADGSEELAAFNERARNRILQDRRALRRFLNSPPRFGFRGTGSNWLDHLQLYRGAGFRRNLAGVEELGGAEALLGSEHNIWRERLAAWQLLDEPYVAATTPDADMIAAGEAERRERVDAYVTGLMGDYGVDSREQAIELYQEEYELKTREIDEVAATIEMPAFVDDPPLTLDDQLDYRVSTLPGGGQLVVSNFENMTSATAGLALRLDVIPAELLVYVASLPALMTEIGVIRDGQPIAYDEFDERLRREVLELSAYHTVDWRGERAELVLRGAGSELEESRRALDWMRVALLHPDLRPENLSRIRDAIDLELAAGRNRMRRSEESWVRNPVNAYWKQENPLLLHTDCFLTQVHDLHRLRWLLKDGRDGGELLARTLDQVVVQAATLGRDRFGEWLQALDAAVTGEVAGRQADSTVADALPAGVAGSDSPAADLVHAAIEDLRASLAELPDATRADDIRYLCRQMEADLQVDPIEVLSDLERTLGLLRHRDNARAFIVSNSSDRAALEPELDNLIRLLQATPASRQRYARRPLVEERLAARLGATVRPVHVGLVNPSTRAGVHLHTAGCASFWDSDREELVDFLAARLFGGGGAHSMFMKTWGAGLAYSNGLRANEHSGRLSYYAERCPDLAQTMQFVVGELATAEPDPALADYAVAQAFTGIRSGSRYEQRGEAMAADLAVGLTPEVVRAFRRGVLEMRREPGFFEDLWARMEATYGEVLPGYGAPGADAARTGDAIYYVIGPEAQLDSWETYLHGVEGEGVVLYRLYPRDYWSVRSLAPPISGD